MFHSLFRRLASRVMFVVIAFGVTPDLWAMRYLPSEVLLHGEVILKIGGGDNGHPNVDEVWAELPSKVFIPTAAFSKLNVPANAQEFVIGTPVADFSRPPLPRPVVVHSAYGGELHLMQLRLIRVPKNESGQEWKLDPEQIKDEFGFRSISRNAADGLPPLEWKRNMEGPPPQFLAGVRFVGFCWGVVACWLSQCVVSWIRRRFRKPQPAPA